MGASIVAAAVAVASLFVVEKKGKEAKDDEEGCFGCRLRCYTEILLRFRRQQIC